MTEAIGWLLDAVESEEGVRYVRVGDTRKQIWIAVAEFHDNSSKVFRRMSGVGVEMITPGSRNKAKKALEQHMEYRSAIVAEQQGWTQNNCYVFGDGSVFPAAMAESVVVVFPANPKASQRGFTKDWQRIPHLLRSQPMATFLLAFPFVGPLLRFAPSDYLNPLIEVVGRTEQGKTTIVLAALASFLGDPASTSGGGKIFDMTLGAADDDKLECADSTLLLDEGSLLSSSKTHRRDMMVSVIMKLAQSDVRRRSTDLRPQKGARLGIMSTSNESLSQLLGHKSNQNDAASSRMLTLEVNDTYGFKVFESLPEGFANEEAAVIELRRLANESYGGAGRRFVEEIARSVQRDEAGFRKMLRDLLDSTAQCFSSSGSKRINKTFALVAAAGYLAETWNIFPKGVNVLDAAREVHRRAAPGLGSLQKILLYAERFKNDIVDVSMRHVPLDDEFFESTHGALLRDGQHLWLYIPTKVFQRHFSDHDQLIRDLKAIGRAKTEGGMQPKLVIKPSQKVCRGSSRCYCVDISTPQAGR